MVLRHKTKSRNLQSGFTGEWLMGFTFPGDTSLQDTGSSYANRGHFPIASSCIEHRTLLPILGSAHANGAVSEWKSLIYSACLSSSPSLWGPGRMKHMQDWAVLVWFSGSQWMLQRHPHHVHGVRITVPMLTPCASRSSATFLRDI